VHGTGDVQFGNRWIPSWPVLLHVNRLVDQHAVIEPDINHDRAEATKLGIKPRFDRVGAAWRVIEYVT
jgi:hypothetical protein